MTSKGKQVGLLEVQQSSEILRELCQSRADTLKVLILDEQDRIIYPLKADLPTLNQTQPSMLGIRGELEWGEDKIPYQYASLKSSYTGWRCIVMRPQNEVLAVVNIMSHYVIMVTAAILLLSLIVIGLLSHSLTRRL